MFSLIARIHTALQARRNCIASGNEEMRNSHERTLANYNNLLPNGSGFNMGCIIDMDRSTDKAIYIDTEFHHMNEAGYYTRWTQHTIKVIPEFTGFDLRVSGLNHRDIKDYIADVFHHDLSLESGPIV